MPDLPLTQNSQSFARTLFAMARRQNMTLRDLYNIAAAARGHWVIWGTPTRIADTLQEWFEAGLADGFMIQPAYFPGAFNDFVDLVVPELQRRGLFRQGICRNDFARPLAPGRRVITVSSAGERSAQARASPQCARQQYLHMRTSNARV